MIKGTDKVSDFPDHFNRLEQEVKSLTKNTRGIKIATWVTAISTAILAIVGVLTFLNYSAASCRDSGAEQLSVPCGHWALHLASKLASFPPSGYKI